MRRTLVRGGLAGVEADPYPYLRAAEHRVPDADVAARGLRHPPHDVQAEARGAVPGAAVAPGERGGRVRDAGARVGDEDDDGVLAVVDVDREGRALGGVPEDVAEQRVERGDEFGAGDRDADRTLDARDADPAVLVLGERRPELHALAHHFGGVTARAGPGRLGLRLRVPGRPDDGVDLALQLLDGRTGLLGGRTGAQRGRVEPEHGERGAQPVGEVGGQFPFVGEELDDLVGHRVERDGGRLEFGRPLLGDARAEPALAEVVGGAREPLRGPDHPDAEPVGDGDGADDQGDADPGEDQPGGGDPVGHLALGDEEFDDGDLAAAERGGLEQREAARHLGDGRAAEPAGGGQLLLAGPPGADLQARGAGFGGRHMDGEPSGGPVLGGGDGLVELLAVGGDGQHGGEAGGPAFGVGERPVTGHLLDDEPEGYGEGEDDHGGDGERHLDERPSHGWGSRGGSSFTPTPRRVCR